MNGQQTDFINLITRNWWTLALRGVVAVIFGILAFVWPGMTLAALVYLFGIYAVLDGILALITAFSAPKGYPRFGGLIFQGLVSIAAGVLVFVWPGISAFVLLILIAAWAIVTGIIEIVTAVELRRVITHEWLLILAGIVSVAFGFLILMQPSTGALALIWWIASFAIVLGILLISLSFRVRRWGRLAHPAAGQAPA
jgi:uncharacterized membrane protein HdeD (DUF308 family)